MILHHIKICLISIKLLAYMQMSPTRPFPSSPGPLYHNEVKCSAFDMQMSYHSHAKTHFHKKGCALGLILKVRVFGTRKWSIPLLHTEKGHQRNRGVCTQAKKFYILLFCNLDIQCKIFPWYYSDFRMTLKWKRANKTETTNEQK